MEDCHSDSNETLQICFSKAKSDNNCDTFRDIEKNLGLR